MSAGRYDLVIEQGASWTLSVIVQRATIDFTGYTVRAKIRSGFNSDSQDVVAITCTPGVPSIGSFPVTLSLTPAQTAALGAAATAPSREVQIGFWDLELESPGGLVERDLEGRVTLSREATK